VTWSGLLGQLLNGLVDASAMFLVAAGLSLIFGVTRIVNFAHGSLYMVGIFLAYSLVHMLGGGDLGFWAAVILSTLAVGLLGAVIEVLLLRRLYRAPELLQLLATFALVLIIKDVALAIWGPDDLFAPRVPQLSGAFMLMGRRIPQYDMVLVAAGPLVLAALWLLLKRSRFGRLIRAATQDREMAAALGINQAWLFTAVFALGSALAGLGGALQSPRMPASLSLDFQTISTSFVVVVVGGMGSIPGAFLAAVLIGMVKAVCIWMGTITVFGRDIAMPQFTLVAEFAVMAVVLVVRPWGLLGRPLAPSRSVVAAAGRLAPVTRAGAAGGFALFVVLAAIPFVAARFPYTTVLLVEIMIAALYAASLHFLVGPGGMHSFGQAAYFGLGAYGAAVMLKAIALPMEVSVALAPLAAGLGAIAFGWFCVRLSGIYLAMLTLAFAQIAWSVVYQWDSVTGGSNGLVGIWPARWLASPVSYYYFTLAIVAIALLALRNMVFSPFGLALRGARDSPLRAEAIGVDVRQLQWVAFIIAGLFSGLAGALYAFSKGSISPDVMSVNRSIDGLVMVLLGGVQSLSGPLVGAGLYTWLSDVLARHTDYWRAGIGVVMLVLVLAMPHGVTGIWTALVGLIGRSRRTSAVDLATAAAASRSGSA